MIDDLSAAVAFTGHRTYDGRADEALRQTVVACHARGVRTFLSGMAVGFDLAAAEAVLACRDELPGLRLVAVVPFEGQQARFSALDRARFDRVLAAADETIVLSPVYHRGVYTVRNDFLVAHAAHLIAWFDGSPGGTHYTVRRAARFGRRIDNLCPAGPAFPGPQPTLFE
ncbi:MAG: DUF1273 domain-containing protein [Alistipes sp.]|nr:DUF1273 domain-containing protein [Alistipes sp.]